MNTFPIHTEIVATQLRDQIVDVTEIIANYVRRVRVIEGMVIAYSPHTTAAVSINENYDPGVKADVLRKLSELIPKDEAYYQHDEGNSDSHVKTSLVGNSVTILIEKGKLVLGKWQGVYFCEFDGPRERQLLIKIVSFVPLQD